MCSGALAPLPGNLKPSNWARWSSAATPSSGGCPSMARSQRFLPRNTLVRWYRFSPMSNSTSTVGAADESPQGRRCSTLPERCRSKKAARMASATVDLPDSLGAANRLSPSAKPSITKGSRKRLKCSMRSFRSFMMRLPGSWPPMVWPGHPTAGPGSGVRRVPAHPAAPTARCAVVAAPHRRSHRHEWPPCRPAWAPG